MTDARSIRDLEGFEHPYLSGDGAVVLEVIDTVLGDRLPVDIDFVVHPDGAFYDEGIALFVQSQP